MSTKTRTATGTSISQVFAILFQIQHMLSPDEWADYIFALHSSLTQGKVPDIQSSAPTALRLFHQMLAEELVPDMARSLPTALAEVYPWAKMVMPVISHYLRFANSRDTVRDHVKDESAARKAVMITYEKVLGDSARGQDKKNLVGQLDRLTTEGPEEDLIDQLGGLKI
jgi:hypothetical protein